MAHPLEKLDKQKGIKNANYDKIPGLENDISTITPSSQSLQNITPALQEVVPDLQIPEVSSSKVPPPIDLEGHEEAEVDETSLSLGTVTVDDEKLLNNNNIEKINVIPKTNIDIENYNSKKSNKDSIEKEDDER